MASPSIREHLHAGLASLEWMVNAYTLTFAVLLLPMAVLGDRLGRRRVFVAGLTVFTLASAACALAPSTGVLVVARAVQGIGGAAVLPLSLTLLTSAVPAARRGAALGVWGTMSGLAVALGPLLGGAVTQGASWQFIFWMPELRAHRGRTLTLIDQAECGGHTRVLEMNQQVLTNLHRMISEIDVDDMDEAADAG